VRRRRRRNGKAGCGGGHIPARKVTIAAGRPHSSRNADAVAPVHRCRTRDAAPREVLHQRNEEGQILRRDALFVEGQDEIATLGRHEEIRVLDHLGNALAGQHLSEVIEGDKSSELVIGNIGIDGHVVFFRRATHPCSQAPPRWTSLRPGLSAWRGSHTFRAAARRQSVRTLARATAGAKQ